ncbi:MAG: PD-(D/E)XK nuclease family protein [Gemmatimonadota bacterium]|nr:PD-(D/E)XK nuclease family protein [Gemmatimonadota bacterium]
MTDQIQVQQVESVLKQIQELKEEDERAAKATGKNFNVFSVPGFGYNELDHSAFLANLLNPEGTHSQGVVFLRHFLKQLDSFDCENLEDFKVTREAYVGAYGRIDILLEKDDACIIIENKIKIDPKDEDRQLNRYYTYAKEKGLQDEQIKLIYLTPDDGIEPGEISLSREDCQRYLDIKLLILMSYKSHILKWMEDCLKEVAKIAPIREVLFQYQALVKGLSGQPINKELTMKISDILIKNYDLIPELENSIPKAKEHIQDKFWEKLAKKIPQVCGLEVWDDMERGRIFKVSGCKSLPSFEIALMVELELYKGVWYGFVLLENSSQVGKCEEKQFKRYVNLVHNALETRDTNEWVLGWKYLKDRNEANLFSDFGAEQMRYIAEDDELKKTVETFAQEIKDAVDKFVKAKEDAGL